MTPTRFTNDANGLIGFYNFMLADRGIKMPDHLIPVCRGLMDDRIQKLMVTIGPGSGKSLLLSVVYPAFRIGQDPTITIFGVSAGEALMQGFQRSVMEWVAGSPRWAAAFPKVKPDKDSGWSIAKGMFVTGRNPGDPDANYAAFGMDSKRLTGIHGRLGVMDDIHDSDNSRTATTCMKLREEYYRTIPGRADPRGCRFILAGRRWHEEDLYGHLAKAGEWVHMNLPAQREGTDLYWDISIPDGVVCCFND